jgi:lysyl-tRNA synthetase class 1
MWYDQIIQGLTGPQHINDSKTPSGRVHVGSLRGVLIHDALFRVLRTRGLECVYRYGVDDYDPLDGLPADATEELKARMGEPLCNIPAPPGSAGTDLADHYIREFQEVFQELGVHAEFYRMRDVYRSGAFNEAIDAILRQADKVRQVYLEVSNSQRAPDWHPFQTVCERCGRVGTTEVFAYDGQEVSYRCRPDLVRWAKGCGHTGKVSPFDGRGKLPWKLEWVAKWRTFGVTIEGAGKDHTTKGGSRDVADACIQALFGQRAPLNVPYEFFLVEGAKMSSSKGIGSSARDMTDLLPPEVLRFLMIRTAPKKAVNFSTSAEYMVKLFNEHDRYLEGHRAGRLSAADEELLDVVEVDPADEAYRPANFQLITALLQLPHVDLAAEVAKRMDGGMTANESHHFQERLRAARIWLDRYAAPEDRLELQAQLPASAAALTAAQRAFLHLLAAGLAHCPRDDEAYQRLIFDTARRVPIEQKDAFLAFYRVLFDAEAGPKGGSLLNFLDLDFMRRRFTELPLDEAELWAETEVDMDAFQAWLDKQRAAGLKAAAGAADQGAGTGAAPDQGAGAGAGAAPDQGATAAAGLAVTVTGRRLADGRTTVEVAVAAPEGRVYIFRLRGIAAAALVEHLASAGLPATLAS